MSSNRSFLFIFTSKDFVSICDISHTSYLTLRIFCLLYQVPATESGEQRQAGSFSPCSLLYLPVTSSSKDSPAPLVASLTTLQRDNEQGNFIYADAMPTVIRFWACSMACISFTSDINRIQWYLCSVVLLQES